MSEQELAIEIGKVDGVKVDDMNLPKASSDEVLQQFAPDSSSADYKDPRLLSCQLDVC